MSDWSLAAEHDRVIARRRLRDLLAEADRFTSDPPRYWVGASGFYTFREAFRVASAAGDTVLHHDGAGRFMPCTPLPFPGDTTEEREQP